MGERKREREKERETERERGGGGRSGHTVTQHAFPSIPRYHEQKQEQEQEDLEGVVKAPFPWAWSISPPPPLPALPPLKTAQRLQVGIRRCPRARHKPYGRSPHFLIRRLLLPYLRWGQESSGLSPLTVATAAATAATAAAAAARAEQEEEKEGRRWRRKGGGEKLGLRVPTPGS